MSEMAYEVQLNTPYDESVDRVIDALKDEGFGVLTRIDVHDAFKQKLDVDFRKYSILGACNPALAHQALSSRPDAGLLLPCNVIVEEHDGGTRVRIIDPAAMMQAGGFAGDPVLKKVGGEAEVRLKRVAKVLSG